MISHKDESENGIVRHKEEHKSRMESDVKDRKGITSNLKTCIDPLDPVQHQGNFVNIVSGEVASNDVNVHDMNEIIWAGTTKTDAARDTVIIDNAPTDTLDPASPRVNLGSKLGIDATQKTKEEGFEREIQEEVKVDDGTKKMVDSKW